MNEILYAGVADQRTAEVLSSDYLMLLAERNALPNHPALFYAGDMKANGSTTIKVPHLGIMGYDLPTQTAETATVGNTALSDGSSTLTIARFSKSYEQSDIAKFSDSVRGLNAQMSPGMRGVRDST